MPISTIPSMGLLRKIVGTDRQWPRGWRLDPCGITAGAYPIRMLGEEGMHARLDQAMIKGVVFWIVATGHAYGATNRRTP
jgi:hypothetical protein